MDIHTWLQDNKNYFREADLLEIETKLTQLNESQQETVMGGYTRPKPIIHTILLIIFSLIECVGIYLLIGAFLLATDHRCGTPAMVYFAFSQFVLLPNTPILIILSIFNPRKTKKRNYKQFNKKYNKIVSK